ncbi:MAG: HupE/UreJ family protein [Acidobacteriota bacterium]
MTRGRPVPGPRILAVVWLAATLHSAAAWAHDIPRDVTVQAFVKPEGERLRLLVRVPLKTMTDVEFPRRERDYVDLARVDGALRDAATVWLSSQIDLYEGDRLLANPQIVSARMSLESDRSFGSYETALAHVTGPRLPESTAIFWEQGILDVLLEYPIQSDRSSFAIHAAFDRLALSVLTVLRFMPPGGVVRAYELAGDAGLVRLDPRWYQAAARFVRLGFFHILDGTDHLLFLLCLVIPFRRVGALVPVVTAFTVAHSATLLASAYNYAPDALWFPPLIETLIAASIVYMALENIAAATLARRSVITFLFGLVHGFGFSFGLQHTLQFAGSHLLTSLLAFNVGVELGQILVLVLLVPALGLLFRFVVAERMGTILLSAIVAHTAWHWMTDRFGVLRQFPWPAVTAAGAASALRWLLLLLVLGGAVALLRGARRSGAHGAKQPTAT